MPLPLSRLALMTGMAGAGLTLALPRPAHAEDGDLEARDLVFEGRGKKPARVVVLVPRHAQPGELFRLVVLLHGLGETYDQRMGAWAWPERYGLGSAYARLRRPPVVATSTRGELTPARLGEINAALAARSFRGLVLACPYTPDVYKADDRNAMLDDYADWIADAVIPRVRREAPVFQDARHTSLDGVSLGGYVGIETYLRRPDAFGAWGSVQGAIGAYRIGEYVTRMRAVEARLGARPIHLETSTFDDFVDTHRAFAKALSDGGIGCELRVAQGPHDQPFLREAGTLEMLLWHERLD